MGGSEEESDDKEEMETTRNEEEIGVAGPPVIFSPEEYGALAMHINPFLQPAPRDSLLFDCTELEGPMREILYETDQWAQLGAKRSFGAADSAGAV